jgi:hypothetical protein
MPRICTVALVCLIMGGVTQNRASAQEIPDPAEAGRFRLGPLRFTPSIALTSLGIDDNVFNDDLDPKQDTTAAVGPAANLWMKLGRSRMTGKVSGQYLYFSKYENQRAWNTADEARWEIPLSRLTPFITGLYANSKERPGYEIDSRAHLRSQAVGFGTEFRLSSKTSAVLTATRSAFAFDEGETFLGADLATALNRHSDAEALQLRFKLTSLTTFVAGAEAIQDRFKFGSVRNADSIKVLPGFEFKPSALISGKVFVGFRRFNALDETVPDYAGPIAAVDALYIHGATRLAFKVNRDLTYSYELTQPYYALTDLGLVMTQRVTHVWDVVGRGGLQTLEYQRLQSLRIAGVRTDTIRQYGAGVGYRVGETLRLGFDAVRYRRYSSELALREYDGLRFGASISYGLPQ